MRLVRLTIILGFVLIGRAQCLSASLSQEEMIEQLSAAETELENLLPKLDQIAKAGQHDAELQLGIGELYARPVRIPPGLRLSAEEKLRGVVSIDPGNKPAWALLATEEIMARAAGYRQHLADLERRILGATSRGTGQIVIRRLYSFNAAFVEKNGVRTEVMPAQQHEPALYKYFADGSDEDVIIREADYGTAREALQSKLGLELRRAVEIVDAGEQVDPANALYNYLRAHAYLVLGQNESAMREIREGAQKERLNTYFAERRDAALTVLRQGGLSDEVSARIADTYEPIGDFINQNLLKPYLRPLSEEYARQGRIQESVETNRMILSIAQQIRQEPLPFPSTYNEGLSNFLTTWAEERNSALREQGRD